MNLSEIDLPALVAQRTTVKKTGDKYVAICPFHKEKTPSMHLSKNGKWRYYCFGCGAKGDALDFIKLTGIDMSVRIESVPIVKSVTKYVTPFPEIKGEVEIYSKNKQRMIHAKPEAVYKYPCGYVLKCRDKRNKKWTPQVMWDGRQWFFGSFPSPRPLYGRTADKVIIVEGEKCVDALLYIIPQTLGVMTWAGGCQAVLKADWNALKDKSIIIWPDADEVGIEAAKKIKEKLPQAKILTISGKPKGWDVADAIEDGWGWKEVSEFIKSALV